MYLCVGVLMYLCVRSVDVFVLGVLMYLCVRVLMYLCVRSVDVFVC